VARSGSSNHTPPGAAGSAAEPRHRFLRGRLWLAVLAALVPIVPIVIGAGPLTASASGTKAGTPLRPVAAAPEPPATVPRLSPTPPQRLTPVNTVQVALITRATSLRTAPDGSVIAPQPTTTQFGSPVAYLVRVVRAGWLGVVSPLAGNNRLGWIPASDATLSTIDWKLEVSLARRQLTVVHGADVVARFPIAIGRPTAPTPTGEFAVTDRLSTGDPEGPYGCCILALSALAPHVIQDWPGGDRIAIHSTPPDTYYSIGDPITHGCMHVTLPEGQWLLDHIPLGTPAIIRSD
jgi:lipoprotein-anchoring transpeptidase ErfK/SrfK